MRWIIAFGTLLSLFGLAIALLLPGDTSVAETIALVITGAVLAVAAITAAISTTRDSPARAAAVVVQKTLEQRLDDLAASMRDSAQIVQQVSAELGARAATAKRLREEAETAEALSRLHKEESDAVGRMLHAQLEGATREIRRDSIKFGIVWFVSGAAASFLVTLLVHPLH